MRPSRNLPSLDLIKGFEAAARHLSFTKAAQELFVTQSAVSRQIKALEDHLGVALFRRYNRALLLTDAGQLLFRTAAEVLRLLDAATAKLAGDTSGRMLTVTTTVSFAALWLVPRLPRFRKAHPEIDVRISANNEIFNLERQDIDLAIRFCEPKAAPPDAIRMSGEEVFPVCGPALLRDRSRPLRKPGDLARHVLLHIDDPASRWPWLNWPEWLEALGIPDIKPAGTLRFSHYDQLIQAAIEGEGVALGRDPLVTRLIRQGLLVAPFGRRKPTSRAYFIIATPGAAGRPAVEDFIAWLLAEIRYDAAEDGVAQPS